MGGRASRGIRRRCRPRRPQSGVRVQPCRIGRWRRQAWTTQIVDVGAGQLLDVVEGRTAGGPIAWLAEQPLLWRDGIEWATLDLSGPYRKVFDVMLPDAVQVADPFHLVKLANQKLDECRREPRCAKNRFATSTCGDSPARR